MSYPPPSDGHGQSAYTPSQYSPPPWQGQPPSGGGSGRALLVVGAVVTVLVVAVVAIVVVAFRQGNGEETGSPRAAAMASSTTEATSMPSAETSDPVQPSPSTAPSSDCRPPQRAQNTPAGWQTVSGKRGLSYDVPADWKVLSCDTLVGWETACETGPFGYCPVRTMSGAAEFTTAACAKNSVALSGLPGISRTTDINAAVRAESDLVAAIYTSDSGRVPTVQLSPPQSLTVGGAPAVQIVATVSGIETLPCMGPTAVHSMIATTVPGQPGCVLFVVSLPQGIPGAPDPALIGQMVSTLRRSA